MIEIRSPNRGLLSHNSIGWCANVSVARGPGTAGGSSPCIRARTNWRATVRAKALESNIHSEAAVSAWSSPLRSAEAPAALRTKRWAAWFQAPVVSATKAVYAHERRRHCSPTAQPWQQLEPQQPHQPLPPLMQNAKAAADEQLIRQSRLTSRQQDWGRKCRRGPVQSQGGELQYGIEIPLNTAQSPECPE